MSRLLVLTVVIAASVGEALFPLKLIQVALGYPFDFCPTGALALGIVAGHLVAVGSFVFVVLLLLRAALPTPLRTIRAAVMGSVTVAGLLWWLFAQPQVWLWVLGMSESVAAAWDATRWTKALGSGVGGLLGLAVAGARQNNEMQRTRAAQAMAPRR